MRIISGMLQNRKDALHLLIVKALYAAHLLLTVIRNTLAQHVFFNTGKKDYFKNFRLDESALETHELGLETEWTGHKLRLLQSWESEGFFPGGALGDFSKIFPGGAGNGEICFFPLKTKKTTFFAKHF